MTVAALVAAPAASMAAGACPADHIVRHDCNCGEQILIARVPTGTRVYAYDQYVVFDGHRDEHFSSHAKFVCSEKGVRVMDPAGYRDAAFSSKAHIVWWPDGKEVAVRPGEPMPTALKADLKSGIAHFKETVKKRG